MERDALASAAALVGGPLFAAKKNGAPPCSMVNLEISNLFADQQIPSTGCIGLNEMD